MAIPSRSGWTETQVIDSLLVASIAARSSEVINCAFEADPFLDDLFRQAWTKTGGTHFRTNVEMDTSPNTQWIGKGGTVSLNAPDILRDAIWDWKCLVDAWPDYRWDRLENSGKEQAINWVNRCIDNVKNSLRKQLSIGFFGPRAPSVANPTVTSGEPNNIPYLLDVTSTGYNAGGAWGTASPLIGGISGADNSWWRHNVVAHAAAFSAGGIKGLEKLRMYCSRFGDTPDWLLMGENAYINFIENWRMYGATTITNLSQVVSERPIGGDLGVENARFHGMRISQSYFYPLYDGVTAGEERIDMVNTKFLKLITRYGKALYTEGPDPIVNQVGDRVWKFAYDCQLICTALNRQGTMYDITAA